MYCVLIASWTGWTQHNTKVRFSPSVRWNLRDEHISCEMDCIIYNLEGVRGETKPRPSLMHSRERSCLRSPRLKIQRCLCGGQWAGPVSQNDVMLKPPHNLCRPRPLTMLQCSISPFVKMKQKMMQVWVLPNTTWIKMIDSNWTCMFVIMSVCAVHNSYSEALPNSR